MIEEPIIIVTGASRGLGAATARAATRLGAGVVLAARSSEPLQALAQEFQKAGGVALAVPVDISQEVDCRSLIDQTLDHYGRIDALVNNAGIVTPIGPLAEVPFSEWEQNWAVNVMGPVRLAQMALPHLRQSNGRIINITSGAAGEAIVSWGAYGSSKAAINYLTKLLAMEEPSVTTIAIRPGVMDTAMQATVREKGKSRMADSNYQLLFSLYQEGRLIPPERSGRAVACLALYAPQEWSGENLLWNESRVQQLIQAHWPPERD